jgi:hypothetical protein
VVFKSFYFLREENVDNKENEYFYKVAISDPNQIDNILRYVFNDKKSDQIKKSLEDYKAIIDRTGQAPALFPFIDGLTPTKPWTTSDQAASELALKNYTLAKFSLNIDNVDTFSEDGLLAGYRERVYQGDLPPQNMATFGHKNDIHLLMRRLETREESMLSTGLASFDKYFKFRKKSVVLGVGITGVGKSIFCANIAMQQVLAGNRVLYISTEMSEDEVADRIFRSYFKVEKLTDQVLLSSPEIKGELRIIKVAADEATAYDFKPYIKEFQPDLVVLDYLGQMTTNQKYSGDYEKYGFVAAEIDNLANQMDVPIFTVSQSNRSSQTKEGGSLERVGHTGIGDSHKILRPMAVAFNIQRTSDDQSLDTYTIDLFKNRFGHSGVAFSLSIDFKTMRISDCLLPEVPFALAAKSPKPPKSALPGLTRRAV